MTYTKDQFYAHKNPRAKDFTASADKYPQGYFKEKPCRRCGTLFMPLSPCHMLCSDDCRDKQTTHNYLNRVYGISLETFNEMFAKSDGCCYICNCKGFKINKSSRFLLAVDHCHETGRVRGLLCHNCNRALGLLQDTPEFLEQGANYLRNH